MTGDIRPLHLPAPGRGGHGHALDLGPADRPVDIIFSHANGFNARTYRSVLVPLAADLRILALDQRGHGRSGLPPIPGEGRDSWDDLTEDLLAMVEGLDLRNVILAGHSMGGTVSLMTAGLAPDRVRSLVLFDPVLYTRDGTPARDPADNPLLQGALRRREVFPSHDAVVEAYTGRGAFKTWSPEALADYVADGFAPTADGQVRLTCPAFWEASNFRAQGHDPWPSFARFQGPVSILRAEQGSTCRLEGREALIASHPALEVETIPGTTHFLPIERPDLVREALRRASQAG